MKRYITTQKKLAEIAGCGEVHLSKVKARKVGLGESLAHTLSGLTYIDAYMWIAGPKASLNKQLREFFCDQRMQKLVNGRKGAR